MTTTEVGLLIRELQKVFDVVRLVDVAEMVPYCPGSDDGMNRERHACYSVWGKSGRCENCISARAFAQRTRLSKFEFIGQDAYYVVSKYLEVENKPFTLEIVSRVSDPLLLDALGQEKLVQTIEAHSDRIYRDSLTGAFNREYYEQQLQNLDLSGALAMLDIDNFKSVNDSFGHLAGDQALQAVVQALQAHMRGGDAVIRYGGDEFLLVFQDGLPLDRLSARLETLRKAVEAVRVAEYPALRVTASIGGSAQGASGKDRIRIADRCMYHAKETKNTVYCE